jgi:tyrosinase
MRRNDLRNRWLAPAALVLAAALVVACSTSGDEATETTGSIAGAREQAQGDGAVRVRKDAKNLTAEEKAELVNAILKLKETPSERREGYNAYDDFVLDHFESFNCEHTWNQSGVGHNSPTLLPWHRELLLNFEAALQEASGNPDLALPYWDWTDQASTDAVFSNDLFGPTGDPAEGYAVMEGPFAKGSFTVNVTDPIEIIQATIGQENVAPMPSWLVRNVGALNGGVLPLPTARQVSHSLTVGSYDVSPFDQTSSPDQSFRDHLEGWHDAPEINCVATADNPVGYQVVSAGATSLMMHNAVHVHTGGLWQDQNGVYHEGTIIAATSPNDPIFFLHHNNVDRIWAAWQQLHPPGEYAPQSDAAEGWNGEDTQWPWYDRTINSLRDTTANGYVFEALPQ